MMTLDTPLKQNSRITGCATFFRDAKIVIGITIAMAGLNLFIKWLLAFSNYHNYGDLTKADLEDVGVATGLMFTVLACVMILKNFFPSRDRNSIGSSFEFAKNTVFTLGGLVTDFVANTIYKYVSDTHSEKNDHAYITEREWIDIGKETGFILFSLVLLLILKDWKYMCDGRVIEDNPNHEVSDLCDNPTINNSTSMTYS